MPPSHSRMQEEPGHSLIQTEVIVGAPVENRAFVPAYISPLVFNNSLTGNINLDYRFGPNDGPSALHDFGISVARCIFVSGHPFHKRPSAVQILKVMHVSDSRLNH
jgi:hypothetical protein